MAETIRINNFNSNTVQIGEIPAWQAWLVCLTAALFFFYEFIQLTMFNVISAPLMSTFYLNAEELGNLSAYYFYANVIFLFSAGTILDGVSTRKVILTALSICIIGTLMLAQASHAYTIAIARFLTGIGSAFCFLSAVRLATRWFPANRLALVTGVIVTMAMLGGLVAQAPLNYLNENIGWRLTIVAVAGLGVIILLLNALIVRDYPPHQELLREQERQQLKSMSYWRCLSLSFLRAHNWLCGIYTSLLNLPIFLLGGLWGISYLQTVHQLSTGRASVVTSMLFLGTICGSPLAGLISDALKLRKLPMLIGAALSLAIVLAIMFLPTLSFVMLLILFFALGLMTSTQVISYPSVAESNPKLLAATSISVVSICAIMGGALFEPLFGWLMDSHWEGALQNGIPVYNAADYQFAMWILPLGFIVSFCAILGIKETHSQSQENALKTGEV